MFESGMGEISVEDTEPAILRQLLKYLYIGKIDQDFSDYDELMVLAIKYLSVGKDDFKDWEELKKYKVDFTDYKLMDLDKKYALVVLALRYLSTDDSDSDSDCEDWDDLIDQANRALCYEDWKSLIVLANKYGLVELADFTILVLLRGLDKDNALELGIFGEMHNSPVLLNISAKFIVNNADGPDGSLNDGWELAMKKYPELMQAIVDSLFECRSNDNVESLQDKLERDMLSLLESGD